MHGSAFVCFQGVALEVNYIIILSVLRLNIVTKIWDGYLHMKDMSVQIYNVLLEYEIILNVWFIRSNMSFLLIV